MKTVYVGLSGGVDSAVAAALLQQQGYRVVGVHLINWTTEVGGADCPWRQDLADARAVAAHLNIPFQVCDFQDQYRQLVVETMVAEYRAGRTPNPDVLCNQEIKFKLFLHAARAAGADLIATGHYARVVNDHLLVGVDDNKDQSYFLYRVDPAVWPLVRFPVGHLTKPAVRRLAAQFGLPPATKPDSQGICFVGPVGLKPFLQQFIPPHPGDVLDRSGRILGRHDGAAYYTIGQRHGLGIGGGRPFYVLGKDMTANTITVTADPTDLELQTDRFGIEQSHWQGAPPDPDAEYQVRVRYRGEAILAQVGLVQDEWQVVLARPERAVAPGQAAVVYRGDRVVGGGMITVPLVQTTKTALH